MMRTWLGVLLALVLQFAAAGVAWEEDAALTRGAQKLELGFWSGGGAVANDHNRDTRVWVAGFRIGKILKGNRDGKFLEYAGEINPAFVVFQGKTVYGFEAIPLLLKWTYGEGRKIRPYTEVGSGLLITAADVPQKTSKFNFTPQARFGFEFPIRRDRAFITGLQYVHISNASIARRNRGYNTLQLHFGLLWYR